MKKEHIKICGYCEKDFETTNFNQIYCCKTCKTYASHERTGKLNKAQQAIRSADLQTKSITPKRIKEIDLIQDHLQSYFCMELENFEGDDGNYIYFSGYQKHDIDAIAEIENVSKLDEDRYILKSSDFNFIIELKTRFQGSNIFNSVTKPIDLFDNGLDPEVYKIYCTIVNIEQVIICDKLSFNRIKNLQ